MVAFTRIVSAIKAHQALSIQGTPFDVHALVAYQEGLQNCPAGADFSDSISFVKPSVKSATFTGMLIASPASTVQAPCVLIVDDPYLAYASISHLFACAQDKQGVHPTAVIDDGATLGEGVVIGAYAVVGRAQIGANTRIGAHSYIDDGVIIGSGCEILAHVAIYHGTQIGNRVRVDSHACIGSEGFGFARASQGWVRIHQLGNVLIGDDVSIGASTMIDRGALDDTIIDNGVIIDNLVQVAHNVKIGARTAIAANTGIAGSTIIGKDCLIGGGVGLCGHLTLADGVHLNAMTMVTKSLPKGIYASGTSAQSVGAWRKSVAHFKKFGK